MRFLQQAWASVTSTTITNCFRRAGFIATTPEDTDGTQTEDDEDDDIPLARLAGMDFADYAGADNMLTTTAPLTEEAIIDEIQSAKDDTATATEPPEDCDCI